MRLILENIGMLERAEMDLKKLTIIAGENDNGKSTVGKVVFCIIKAISRYKEDLQESKEFKINEALTKLFFFLRREVAAFKRVPELYTQAVRAIGGEEHELDDKLACIEHLIVGLGSIESEAVTNLKAAFDNIKKIHAEPENKKKSIENALRKVFASEFDSSVLLNGKDAGFIQLFDGDTKLIDVKVLAGNKIQLFSDIEKVELRDATFIETPLILNNHDLLIRSQSGLDLSRRHISRLGIPYTTLHTKDLFDKLIELPVDDLLSFLESNDNSSFKNSIKSIIDGELEYDRQLKDFIFIRNEESLSIKNTASGVKAFGILQLLSDNGFINEDTILIFDEPENHLHPKWQLNLAKLLVSLAKSGVHILISSHSPYMLEALKRYSDNAELETETGFYLAENKAIDNKDNLEAIFSKLAEPFDVFRAMDEESLKDE